MSQHDTSDGERRDRSDPDGGDVRDRIERGADRAAEQFDEGVVELLSWVLDTETRARIYVALRQYPDSTSEEVAEETGLYPSTVRSSRTSRSSSTRSSTSTAISGTTGRKRTRR